MTKPFANVSSILLVTFLTLARIAARQQVTGRKL
jgi:hypothetical protein